jgi:capsular exopolysaccharide synthesis family protein
LALAGKKVVLMELDLRKPNIAVHLDLSSELGFTNYVVSSEVTADNIILPSNIHPNFFLIPSGPLPPNPVEILLEKRTDLLMAELKEQFDYIIIDAPPAGIVTDAQLLSKYADLCVYLIRQKYTFRSQLAIIEDIHQNNKMKKIALVMNDVPPSKGYGYGYQYGYGYTS